MNKGGTARRNPFFKYSDTNSLKISPFAKFNGKRFGTFALGYSLYVNCLCLKNTLIIRKQLYFILDNIYKIRT